MQRRRRSRRREVDAALSDATVPLAFVAEALGRDGAADGRTAPAGLRHPPLRTGRATFTASGSPSDGLDRCVGNIGFSAILVGFIHPASGVVRFVPLPSDCPPFAMRPAFPASDYYEGSATRPALAEGWPTPLPESRTCFPSSTRLHLHAVLGPACTPGTARCRARHRRMPIKGSTASLPEQGCLCKEETEIPMTPPSPYRERVVHGATLQSAVPFVTITALWLAARGVVGWPPPHCREGFRHDSASGPRACFPSHRPTPGRVPHLERSTYALLGAPSLCLSTPSAVSSSMTAWARGMRRGCR